MKHRCEGSLLFVRAEPGDALLSSIERAFSESGWRSAVIVSGVGMLSEATLSYFAGNGTYADRKIVGGYELLSLQGNVVRDEQERIVVHAHAVVSDESNRCVGGHVKEGLVQVTAEVFLIESSGLWLTRRLEAHSGLYGLQLD